jgi:hypothetical protein
VACAGNSFSKTSVIVLVSSGSFIVPVSSGFSTAVDGKSFSNDSKFNEPSVPISSGLVKVVSVRVEQIHAITESCLLPTPTTCIRTVCMHVGDSRASSSTRAPSSNDNLSEFSADSHREPSSSQEKLRRAPLTPADYTNFAAEAIFECWSKSGAVSELGSNHDVASFCAQLARPMVDDETKRRAIVRVASEAFNKGTEMKIAQVAQRAILSMVKQRR